MPDNASIRWKSSIYVRIRVKTTHCFMFEHYSCYFSSSNCRSLLHFNARDFVQIVLYEWRAQKLAPTFLAHQICKHRKPTTTTSSNETITRIYVQCFKLGNTDCGRMFKLKCSENSNYQILWMAFDLNLNVFYSLVLNVPIENFMHFNRSIVQ